MTLFHGGAPGFRVGDLIEPHETKHDDDCEWCRQRLDENHEPDRVFATTFRLYARYYASKWGQGSVYVVEPVGEMVPSDADPFETYHAPAFRVVRLEAVSVTLDMTERRRLYRLWGEADVRLGRPKVPGADVMDVRMRLMLGMK